MIIALALIGVGVALGIADVLLDAALRREKGRRLAGVAISHFVK